METRGRRRRLTSIAIAIALAPSCKGSEETPEQAESPSKAEPATPIDDGPPPVVEATGAGASMLEWLDPEAVTVMWVDLPAQIDSDVLASVFAMPPKIARMLRDARGVDAALDAVLDPSSPRPSEWLSEEALASSSVVSSGTYVLRTLTKPAADVQAMLEQAGMQRDEVEGFAMFMPDGPFPWKVAFLDESVVAFIPVKEIGTGLSPVTAGRDLPPSPVESQLRQVLANAPAPLLELYAAGPLLHLDLGQDVQQFELRLVPWQGKGIDAQMVLHPMHDAEAAADALRLRELDLETDTVDALAKRVAFTVEQTAVLGRLQMTPEDVAALGGG
jgi:hypothetical protein